MKTKSPSKTLRFDEEKHQYWLGEKRIPGVSEILQKVGLTKNYDGVDPFFRDRGRATHKAIELHLQGILDPSSLDLAVTPHFEAFLKYWDKRKEDLTALECPMADPLLEFCGTPDLVTDRAIYDWKCSKSHDKVADLQGQAYKILALKKLSDLDRPFLVVELHEDGTFEEFNYGTQYAEWASVLSLYRWRISRR